MQLSIEEAEKIMAEHHGNLFLSNCPDITSLPEGLVVDRDLVIECRSRQTPFQLPKGLVVGGDLRIHGSSGISHLPEKLKVVGRLIMSRTFIEEIPDDVKVGRDNMVKEKIYGQRHRKIIQNIC